MIPYSVATFVMWLIIIIIWYNIINLATKVLEKTKDQEKFMAWMTTASAHQPYTQYSKLGDKHLALFKGTKYNTSLKRYMSKLKEFDLAVGALIEGLEDITVKKKEKKHKSKHHHSKSY